jgi:acyl-CoA synthetase (AMP-forming)/AMP-acid ligase II/acyl carrier protein
MNHTIWKILRAGASYLSESPAILAPKRLPLSHSRLWRQVRGMAAWLKTAGIGRSDRVAIVLPNGPDMAVSFLGVSTCAVSAPLNPAFRAEEFEYYLADLQPKALIVQRGVDSAARAVADARGIAVIELAPVHDDAGGIFELNDDTLIGSDEGGYAEPTDVALVLHTSGTTSRPKTVPLTHLNLSVSAANVVRSLALSDQDRCLNVMPLFHIHGLVAATLASLSGGGSVICTPGFDGAAFFGWLNDLRPTWYTAVPTIHQEILRRAPRGSEMAAARGLRFIRSSSAALPSRVMAELEDAFGVPVIETYGMTEASHQIASNPLPPLKRMPGSVGCAAGCEVAIMNDQGTVLPIGELGEVAIRGQNVAQGYENNPAINDLTFANGWCRTGDQGRLDADGYLVLTGRLKEIINRGGEKIAPREIADVLLSHPDVREAVAFAVAHATLGQAIAAAVVPRDGTILTEAEMREFTSEHLLDFKVPDRIVIVTQIPKGPTGKLQSKDLADLLAQELTITYEPPADDLERLAAAIFEQVLQVDRVGRADNFFAIGGDSITAMQVVVRLVEALRVEIPLTTLFHHPTPASLAIDLASASKQQEIDSLAAELQQLSRGEAARLLRRESGDGA